MNGPVVAIGMAIIVAIVLILLPFTSWAGQIPPKMMQHKSLLIGISRQEKGMSAPIPVYAALVHQESAGNCNAESAYAQGCTQFTPDTADWASMRWPDLKPAQVFNPSWAFRAAIRYLDFLDARVPFPDPCERMAGSLSAYNGGLGNTRKDIRLSGGLDYWFNGVEHHSNRAAWAFKENRDYPRKILHQHQQLYQHWGGTTVCIN